MIKYYSTLTDTFHDKEKDAQKAEDKYVEDYFDNLSLRAAAKKRKVKTILNNTKPTRKITII